jgi:hypothetical protein
MIGIFAGTIFSSAFLLFLVQPIVSKNILPWFGGSAAVWAVCMVFFQVVLLAGYAYSDWMTRTLRPRAQVALHAALLAGCSAATGNQGFSCPGTQLVPASGTRAIAAASIVSATRSSGSR